MQEAQTQPFDLSLIGKIKFPTADDKKGLGTGEYDETIGLEFDKRVLPQGTAFIDAYYTFIGSPQGAELKNRFSFDVGLTKEITPSLTASVFYEESTPLISENANVRYVMINIDHKVTEATHLFAGGSIGLTDTSADYGITIGANAKF